MIIVVVFDVIHKRPLLSSDGKLMEANKALRLLMVLWEQFTHKLLSFSLRKRLKLGFSMVKNSIKMCNVHRYTLIFHP